jgi:hypothetical protein
MLKTFCVLIARMTPRVIKTRELLFDFGDDAVLLGKRRNSQFQISKGFEVHALLSRTARFFCQCVLNVP